MVDDESQMGDPNLTAEQRQKLMQQKQKRMEEEAYQKGVEEGQTTRQLTRTRRGGVKPGSAPGAQEDLDLSNYDTRNLNMGDLSERRGQRNPLQAFADLAGFSPKNN